MNQEEVRLLQERARTVRADILTMLNAAKSGHSAGPLGMTDIFTVLYNKVLKHNPKKPLDKSRDYVFLSNGHICPVLYATLADQGYFEKKELHTLRKLGSRLQGHPHLGALPGIENSGGPLGQGASMSCGAALGLLREKKKNTVYCFLGDGELDEGQCWEAAMFANQEQLKNLIWIIDYNNIQIDGFTNNVMTHNDLAKKFESFGWATIRVSGHDMQDIYEAFIRAKDINRPTVIIAYTIPGRGVSFMEDDYRWHGKAPNNEELEEALKELA